MVRLVPMRDELDAEATQTPRGYGWAMLLASIAIAVVGVGFLTNAAGWWSYATGAIALAGAALLIYFGVKALSPTK
jgi:threonine/homoserine/homoserine lactone efflux protein